MIIHANVCFEGMNSSVNFKLRIDENETKNMSPEDKQKYIHNVIKETISEELIIDWIIEEK